MAGDNSNVWKDIELWMDPDPFGTSCEIHSMKKARSKIPLNPKSPFWWVFMDDIPSTAPICLTSDNTFSNYLLILMHNQNFQNFIFWIKLVLKEWWISWIRSNLDVEI